LFIAGQTIDEDVEKTAHEQAEDEKDEDGHGFSIKEWKCHFDPCDHRRGEI
jgi:hypothetical protein